MGIYEKTQDSGVNCVHAEVVEEGCFEVVMRQDVFIDGDMQEDDQAYLIDVKKELKALKEGGNARLPIFVGEKEGEEIYVLPMYG